MNIICFSDICWDFIWQRHQQLLTRFPASWKILFIEPISLWRILENPKSIIPRKINNIVVFSVPRLSFFENKELLRKINDFCSLLIIKAIIYKSKITRPILLFYEPRYSSIIGHLDEKLILYEFIDNRLGFTEVPIWMRYYIELLIKKADVVTASSNNLYNYALSSSAKNVFLVRNAADVDHFKKKKYDIPEDIKHLKKPIIGYVGALYEWFDFELIEKMAIKFFEYTILLIGPIHPEQMKIIAALGKYENICFAGKKSYDELPEYISQFDIAIIPFKINNLTNYVNPVKLYEYIAADKPVISTALPDIFEYKDVVYIADNHEEFLQAIEISLIRKQKGNYVDILINNTWDKRAEQMIKIIQKYSNEDA